MLICDRCKKEVKAVAPISISTKNFKDDYNDGIFVEGMDADEIEMRWCIACLQDEG